MVAQPNRLVVPGTSSSGPTGRAREGIKAVPEHKSPDGQLVSEGARGPALAPITAC
jgi:hypothetical protein